ncbi:acyl carrier protein [Brevundimonas kwangchunensis]
MTNFAPCLCSGFFDRGSRLSAALSADWALAAALQLRLRSLSVPGISLLSTLHGSLMSPETFLQEFSEILEIEVSEISLETKLSDLSIWDSINVLGYMMMVDEKAGRQVDPDSVKNAETVGDLYNLAVG